MTELIQFWPSIDNISDCIVDRQEAVTSNAILLAIHRPMALQWQEENTDSLINKIETDVLLELTKPNPDAGGQCVTITGASGSGKTHLVRWLEAQIVRDPKLRERYKCIRVPKSASLRSVVEHIIQPLEGDPAYDNIRSTLENVIPDLDERAAANDLTSKLRTRLENKEIEIEKNEGDSGQLSKEDRLNKFHCQRLRAYINELTIEEHIRDSVLMRIVRQATSRHNELGADDQSDFEQFEPEDFNLPDHIDVQAASNSVISYYDNLRDPSARQRACDILNSVLSDAVGDVFNIQQLADGRTWGELFGEIRRIFKQKEQELVFLVEDFFALTGMQKPLVSVLIGESESEEWCNIRSAIGVTDGYRAENINSYISRGGGQFLVSNLYETQEEALTFAVNMVGGYLNAGRWGKDNLERELNNYQEGDGGWKNFYNDGDLSEQDKTIIEKFGLSDDGYPLFPLNKDAIKTLAKHHLLPGDRKTFEPRILIKFILQKTLRLREKFENKAFPPLNLSEGINRQAAIDQYIMGQNCPDGDKERLKSFVSLWCGNPQQRDQLRADEIILKTFNLPKMSGVLEPVTEDPPTVDPPTGDDPPPPKLNLPTQVWEGKLENWVNGQSVSAKDANELRISIRDFIINRIRWDVIRVKIPSQDNFDQSLIGIPIAQGGGRPPFRIFIEGDANTTEINDIDGSLRQEMTAIGHYIEMGGWEYEGGELERAQAYNLIDRMVPEFEAYFIEKATKELSPLLVAAGAMATLRGTPIEGKNDWNALFLGNTTEAPKGYTFDTPSYQEVYDLQRNSFIHAKGLESLIFDRCGCYQGAGNTAYAVDVARLKNVPEDIPLNTIKHLFPENFAFFQSIRENQLSSKARNFVKQIGQDLRACGDVFKTLETGDPVIIASLLTNAQGNNMLKGNRAFLQTAFDTLNNSQIKKSTLEKIEKTISKDQPEILKMGQILAQIDLTEFVKVQKNCLIVSEFLESLSKNMEQHAGTAAGAELTKRQEDIKKDLEEIKSTVENMVNV
ncbi:protein DpdH [Rhodospirillales bacterium]|nr:protein DpdH [Rhodospirillales bacterium]